MLYTEGISYLLEDDPARADPILTRAFGVATGAGATPLTALILAELCQVAAERGDWDEITTLAERAVGIVQAGHFDDYWTSALVYAWATRSALHRGTSPWHPLLPGRAGEPAQAAAHVRPPRSCRSRP